MTTKMINIAVPLSWTAPEIINTLNVEENAFILDVGCEMIKEARSLVVGLSQKEIYNKIREESKSEIQKLELDLLVQKEIQNQIESNIRGFYENQMIQMKKQNEELKEQIKVYQCENKDFIKTEVEKEKEKFKIILEEKDKQLKMINETHDYIYLVKICRRRIMISNIYISIFVIFFFLSFGKKKKYFEKNIFFYFFFKFDMFSQ